MNTHLDQAQHNREVADKVEPTSHQWAITCLFYAALHYVNAHVGSRPLPTTHADRDAYVRGNMRSVYLDYRWLRTKSENVRYRLCSPPKTWLAKARSKADKIQKLVVH